MQAKPVLLELFCIKVALHLLAVYYVLNPIFMIFHNFFLVSEDAQSKRSRSESESPIRYEPATEHAAEMATSPGSNAGSPRSHTSLDTNYSERRRSERRSSSSSSSVTVTSDQSESDSEDETPVKVPPATPKPVRRRDTFFDQRQAGPDYSSVIDSLSQSTEQDNAHDFDSDRPNQTNRHGSYSGPRLVDDGETARFRPAEIHGDEKTTTTVRLSLNDPQAQEQEKYLDGFKVGSEDWHVNTCIEAWTKWQKVCRHYFLIHFL